MSSSHLIRSLQARPYQAAESRQGTYFVQTWGCQMNVEDSEQIELYMQEIGFQPAVSPLDAQVILLNTCSVRKKPEDKAFSMLGELVPLKAARPDTVIGVCGCMAQIRADEIRRRAPHVDFVVGTAHISGIAGLVEEALQRRAFAKRLELPERKGAVVTDRPRRNVARTAKLKAFVPIQYGCDKFCTFCIVPTTRGRERSRPTEEIVEEVRSLALQGTKEITLLGQTVNSYGKNMAEGKVPFARLLELLSDVDGIERIRYTSPYPRDFGDELIGVHGTNPTVMPHCHLPLQSGSDETLRAMKRLYTVESYGEIYAKLRRVPEMAITTDVIVGFPGETDEQFAQTLQVVERLRFDSAFMFAYSPRPGTSAAVHERQVPLEAKRERLAALIQLQNRITCEIHQSMEGTVHEVLVEGRSEKNPAMLKGISRNFKTFHFSGPDSLVAHVALVRAVEPHLWGFMGEIVESCDRLSA